MNKPTDLMPLFSDVKRLIDDAKEHVAIQVNSTMTLLYWRVGHSINEHILGNSRAEYGKQVIINLSVQLQEEYGVSLWSEKNLRRMMQFASVFPDCQIVATLSRQLSWSHIKLLLPIDNELQRDFYIELCKLERWSVRTLKSKIDSMLYERTAIAKRPEEVIRHDIEYLRKDGELTADTVVRDPYFIDFLGLRGDFSEKDLEDSIVMEMQSFITEMGNDFAFLSRQKRITVDDEDYYIDLLFYHRRLRCLVAIELKLGKFKAAYKGQMELYLRWLERHEMMESENKPIGLILCAGKNEEHVELLHLDDSNIRVAEYMTKLPDRKILEQKLQQAIDRAKNRLIQK